MIPSWPLALHQNHRPHSAACKSQDFSFLGCHHRNQKPDRPLSSLPDEKLVFLVKHHTVKRGLKVSWTLALQIEGLTGSASQKQKRISNPMHHAFSRRIPACRLSCSLTQVQMRISNPMHQDPFSRRIPACQLSCSLTQVQMRISNPMHQDPFSRRIPACRLSCSLTQVQKRISNPMHQDPFSRRIPASRLSCSLTQVQMCISNPMHQDPFSRRIPACRLSCSLTQVQMRRKVQQCHAQRAWNVVLPNNQC